MSRDTNPPGMFEDIRIHSSDAVRKAGEGVYEWTTKELDTRRFYGDNSYNFRMSINILKIESDIRVDGYKMIPNTAAIRNIWLLCDESHTTAELYLSEIRGINVGYSKALKFTLTSVKRETSTPTGKIIESEISTLQEARKDCNHIFVTAASSDPSLDRLSGIKLYQDNCEIQIWNRYLSKNIKANGITMSVGCKEFYVLSFQFQPQHP